MERESFSHKARITWSTAEPVDFVRSQRCASGRWNVTPCNALLVQFAGDACAYRLELTQVVQALVEARTASHSPPNPTPNQPRRLRTGPVLRVLVVLLSGLLTGCLSASLVLGVWTSRKEAPHVHRCEPVIGYPVQICADCGEACLSLAFLSSGEVV